MKKVGTYGNVSDLTTKHHDEEGLKVLMTLGRLRDTRGHEDSVSTANGGRTATVNAVRRSKPIELDKNVLRQWAGYRAWRIQVEASVESSVTVFWPRGAKNSTPQMRWLSVALATRRFDTLKSSEFRRRGCHHNDWTGDANNTPGVAGCKPCTDTDRACDEKPPSAHDDERTDLV